MTLFFLILLTVSLVIFGFQKLKKKDKLTIKPSLPKIEELVEKLAPEEPIIEPKPEWPVSVPIQPVIPELHKESEKPPGPEPITKESEPVSLPPEQEPILLSPKDPEPPGNLPTG